MQAELHHEPVEDAKEARVVVEAVLDQIVETVGGQWRPHSLDGNHKRALARVEPGPKRVRCLFSELRRVFQPLDVDLTGDQRRGAQNRYRDHACFRPNSHVLPRFSPLKPQRVPRGSLTRHETRASI